jgi:pyrimidine-nucleoside phosphorylase
MSVMNTYELIKKKRDGHALSKLEIDYLINGFVAGNIPDYQMAAFLMAVYFKGMRATECVDLTMSMVGSGSTVDLSPIKGFTVDKHSTGGVGDKTTLVLAPLVASCGAVVAKMTGRELGHTGGTADKLESIPGMSMAFSRDEFVDIANRIQVSIIAQTETLTPADKLMYALRNVTATVDTIPLIASSIMSKKLAAGADGIVLDVKTGAGAFTPLYTDAMELAKTMVGIGEGAGRKCTAYLTAMAQPLGCAIGNALEVKEAIDTLNGFGPADLTELVLALGSEMLILSGIASSRAAARQMLENHLAEKKGARKFKDLIKAQGGDPAVIENPDLLPQAREQIALKSERSGKVQEIDALEAGMAAKILGSGRQTKDQDLDLSIGIVLKKKVGDPIEAGETLAVLHTDGDRAKIEPAAERLSGSYVIGSEYIAPPRLIQARVRQDSFKEFNS